MNTEDKEKIVDKLEGLKEFRIYYKFSDVVMEIMAKDEDDAKLKADEMLIKDEEYIKESTSCYEIEVEEDE